MSDWTIFKHWWQGLTRTGDAPFLAVSPPTRARYTQSDAHHDASVELAARGLPPGTPYAVWNWQQHAFDRAGSMTRGLWLNHGGNRSVVAERLGTLPDEFELRGGRSDTEAFYVQRVRDLTKLPTSGEQADAELAQLSSPVQGSYGPAEIDWLRRLLRDPQATPRNRQRAFSTLAWAGSLANDDLDVALAEVWQIWPPTESAVPNPLASELISRGHSGADWLCERLTLLERGQISDDVLLAWGSERAFRFAQERATSTGEYLKVFLILDAQRRQVSIRQAGTELAHDLPERPELRESLAKDLPRAMLADEQGRVTGKLVPTLIELLADDGFPDWFRALLPRVWRGIPEQLRRSGSRGAALSPQRAQELIAAWEAAVAASSLGSDEGWAGIDLDARTLQRAQYELVDLSPSQIVWFRERMHDPETTEPGLGFCIGKLLEVDALTSEDLDALLAGWRKRMAVKPDPYQTHPPAMVALGIALARAEHPKADTFWQSARKLTQKWAVDPLGVLHGWYGTADDLAGLLAHAKKGSAGALTGWVLLTARLEDLSVGEAAGRALALGQGSPRWFGNHAASAAIAWRDPARPLWKTYFDERSMAHWENALAVIRDDSLDPELRSHAVWQASRHRLVFSAASAAELGATTADWEAATAALAQASAGLPKHQ